MATNDRGESASSLPSGDSPELSARVTTTSDGTTECTIFPKHIAEDERTTTWITAAEGSYVDVEDIR